MANSTPNPFICGRPVQPSEFLGRDDELRTVFNRLRNCESTAVVGEPHIGKTSLLLKVTDETTQRDYLGDAVSRLVVSSMDLQPISNDYAPVAFWEKALEPLMRQPGHRATAQRLDAAAESGYAYDSLVWLFEHLGEQDRWLVLLLDEFERLLSHRNFQDPAFFALMRSLASRTGGLAVVTASRLSIEEMNEQGRKLLDTGSPLFNHLIPVRLSLFNDQVVATLLRRAEVPFSISDRRFIRRVAGCHPFLLQAMAATMAETRGGDRHARAAEAFYDRISSHFDDLWRTLDDDTRTTAVILSLIELGKRAFGQRFACGQIENVAVFGDRLRQLEKRGLAERAKTGWELDLEHLLLWRGERWTIGSQAFAWWVRDVVIAGTRRVPIYEEWLEKKRYLIPHILTQDQWDWLVGTVRRAPKWAVRGVGGLARALFKELVEGE